jgi:hypothetical protein
LLQIFSKIKAYNALVLPIPLYGSEISNFRKKVKKMTSMEMKFLSTTNGYNLFDNKSMKKFWKS